MTLERSVTTLLTEIAGCLCSEVDTLVKAGQLPSVCFCGIVPGNEVPFDYATDGMAWVRAGTIMPMVTEDFAGRQCATEYDISVQVGMLYCAPTLDENNELPDVEEMLGSTVHQMRAMGLMHKVITCCGTSIGSKATIGDYTPVGPQGGIVGGAWTATWRVS